MSSASVPCSITWLRRTFLSIWWVCQGWRTGKLTQWWRTSAGWSDRGKCVQWTLMSEPLRSTMLQLQRKSQCGFWGWYRSFYKKFTTAVASLIELLNSNVKFVQSPHCQSVFENVKSLLCSALSWLHHACMSHLCSKYQSGGRRLSVDEGWRNWQTHLLIVQKVQIVSKLIIQQ